MAIPMMLPIEKLPDNFPYKYLRQHVEAHPFSLLFVTICGAHSYGFDSLDSSYDLRGVHILPLKKVGVPDPDQGAVESSAVHDGIKITLATENTKRFFGQLLENNGSVLEHLFSPLVVHTTPGHEELKELAIDCITRQHARYYHQLATAQWNRLQHEERATIEPLLQVYRLLLTGIHLMRTGAVVTDLTTLNETETRPGIDELIDLSLAGPTMCWLEPSDLEFHGQEYKRLVAELESAAAKSALPELPSGKDALDYLMVRLRIA